MYPPHRSNRFGSINISLKTGRESQVISKVCAVIAVVDSEVVVVPAQVSMPVS